MPCRLRLVAFIFASGSWCGLAPAAELKVIGLDPPLHSLAPVTTRVMVHFDRPVATASISLMACMIVS